MKIINIAVLACCALLVACGGGGQSDTNQNASERQVQSTYAFNQYGHLIADSSKTEVPCPAQTAATMVIYAFGQSNSANHAEYNATATSHKIVNYYNGKCYAAADPLLGASGTMGSQWVLLANRIVDRYDAIVLMSGGIGATSIGRWVGDLNPQLRTTWSNAKADYTITHFLWHQGESDAFQMSGTEYTADLAQLINASRVDYPASKFYVSIASLCGSAPADPVIQAAQQSVVDAATNIFQGINTDQLLGPSRRMQNCHFNRLGQETAADAWASLL